MSPYSAFNAEDIGLGKILEVIFHLPKAQSHEVHLLPFTLNLDKPCPREGIVCAMPRGGCGFCTPSEASIALHPGAPLALGYAHFHLVLMHLTT